MWTVILVKSIRMDGINTVVSNAAMTSKQTDL